MQTARFVLVILGLAACQGPSTPTPTGPLGVSTSPDANATSDLSSAADLSVDLAASAPDLAPICACGENQVCVQGQCQDVPTSCPCPIESYCDLSTTTCVVGCTSDSLCNLGRYCDTSSRKCKDGCRVDTDCAIAEVCQSHACVNLCPNCDDGKPCTVDSCVRGQCSHSSGNDGAVCASATACTQSLCQSGQCKAVPIVDGTTCGAGTVCTQNVCQTGTCKSVPLADYTPCGAASVCTSGQECSAGVCLPVQVQDGSACGMSSRAPICTDSKTLRTYSADRCEIGMCAQDYVDETCVGSCSNGTCTCEGAVCTTGSPCYQTQGTCSNGVCNYTPVDGRFTYPSGCCGYCSGGAEEFIGCGSTYCQ